MVKTQKGGGRGGGLGTILNITNLKSKDVLTEHFSRHQSESRESVSKHHYSHTLSLTTEALCQAFGHNHQAITTTLHTYCAGMVLNPSLHLPHDVKMCLFKARVP